MRPTGQAQDAGLVVRPGVVAGVGVGLREPGEVLRQVVKTGGLAARAPLMEDVAPDAVARRVDHPEISGGAFPVAGFEETRGRSVGLEAAALRQPAVDGFVKRPEGVGDDFVPAAERVAGDIHAVAVAQDALGAAVGPVVAILRRRAAGHHAGGGARFQGERRRGLEGNGGRPVGRWPHAERARCAR